MRAVLIAALLFAGLAAFAAEPLPPYPAELLRVVDGDTIDARVAIWPQQSVETRIRLDGLDTPEKNSACAAERAAAHAAAEALAALLGDRVVLRDLRSGKYAGRFLATVTTADGRDVARAMIEAGHARPYHGGRRRPWCDAAGELTP